ncbi:flagellar hook-basal body protein [Peredibacter starrii]|uniref:Flagellar hook-basal body protein n=1 Tax=Peredibacter starrii TaxID=28202 RepID=A0AAX4HPS5_9BACT|nr:flagellar hook-basal body protein [Peredibacter starrii]WPU65287.1 flagellar hook-basal body protein [Peredibacter starrii]
MKNIWVPLSGQVAQQRKVETIANNVANANTVGFKKDQLVFKEHLTALTQGVEDIDIPRKEFSPADFYHTQGVENAMVAVDGSFTIFEQGQLTPTSNPLDVGLQGDGFLEVLTPTGVRFTRKGNLSLSREGELVTDQGFKVLSSLNVSNEALREPAAAESFPKPEDRILRVPTNMKLTINQDGEVLTRDGVVGKLSVVEFQDKHALRKEGNSLYITPDETNINRTNIKTTVNQGFLEGSNVNAIEEMSELIKAHRHFESIQKAINTYDSISGKAANDIGKF